MKSLLIATTALVSVLSLTAQAGVPARQTASHYYPPDANREFLCNYGFTVSTKAYISSSYLYDYSVRAAIPVMGKGKKVAEIIVANAPLESKSPSGISVAIFSSRKNMPFEQLTFAHAAQPQQCERIKLAISPMLLAKGKKYWVVETAQAPFLPSGVSSATNSVSWLYDKKRSKGALSQAISCVSSSCFSLTPWQSITGGVPYAKVK